MFGETHELTRPQSKEFSCITFLCKRNAKVFATTVQLARADIIHSQRDIKEIFLFTITAEIQARSLANFYCQYADRHMNLKFMQRVSE